MLIPGAVFAGPKLEVARKGAYVYWFTYKDPLGDSQVTMPQRFKGRSADLDTASLSDKSSDAKLHVMDKATGNTAIADFAAPKPGEKPKPIKLKASDFEYVQSVRLRIVSKDGEPIESASVRIIDGEGRAIQSVVTPADQGVAAFQDVATGEISVKVNAEGVTKTIDSDITLPEKRKTPGFEEDVRVAGDVNTLPVPKGEKKQAGGKAAKETGGSSGLIFQSIVALVFIIVVIAVIYAIVKSKGVTKQDLLRQLGMQQQGEQQVPVAGTVPGPAVDPNVCQFCGQRKDAMGNCACSVTPGTTPYGAPAPAAGGTPRLVGTQGAYSGHIFELTAPAMVVGRESGDIVLSNDSTISRKHVTISESGGVYTVRDEGSSNGTFVNGARITEQKLNPGDEVQLGGTRFRFEV